MNYGLNLVRLDCTKITGIYGYSGRRFAKRMAYLDCEAAHQFELYQQENGRNLSLSDMYRTASASLRRRYSSKGVRKGVARPGYSAHNFGLAIDLAVDRTLQEGDFDSKGKLDSSLAEYGWFCHRKDGRRGSEDWHYNYLGVGYKSPSWRRRTSGDVENKIVQLHSEKWKFNVCSLQSALSYLGLYAMKIDGDYGPGTTKSVEDFQRRWKLSVDGKAGKKTNRLLWVILAQSKSPAQTE